MIAGLDDGVVVGNDHLFIANNRADGGARRQADIADGLADDLARFRVTVGNCLMDIGQPKAGETLVVAAASGAVGSVVGQVAKLKGLRVVGIAGGADKCRYVVDELGFDACVDHKSATFANDLALACFKGVDIYFENVGGIIIITLSFGKTIKIITCFVCRFLTKVESQR